MAGNMVRRMWTPGCLSVVLASVALADVSAQSVAVREATTAPASVVTIRVNKVPLRIVLDRIATQAGLAPFYSAAVVNSPVTVSVQLRNVPVMEAFTTVLTGTGLRAMIKSGNVIFVETDGGATVVQGGITGKVIDAKTKAPLRGAKVTLDDAATGVTSEDDGTFRFGVVPPGTHTLHIRRLGYLKAVRAVSVTDGHISSVEIALDASVNALDQVVVTGTIVATRLKAVPNAITVITAKDIEQRGITRIDQLFRGDVPGLFAKNQGSAALLDEVVMFSRGATALSSTSAGLSPDPGAGGESTPFLTNPIKTYVDGVELANPKYLNQIDPRSIERIEILTGPQASTIYGSNAINGVMQIFTKRGTSNKPQVTLNLLSGWVENNFSSSRTPQHDYSAQLSGVEGRLSYNAGGSWNYMGPWTPAKQTATTSGFGGARLELPTSLGHVTADVTLRRSFTKTRQRAETGQTFSEYQAIGWYDPLRSRNRPIPNTRALTGQTLGLALTYTPTSWWSHELGLGQDASDAETRATERGYSSSFDTTLYIRQTHADRRSLHYSTTVQLPVTSFAQATVTAGADAWQNMTSSVYGESQTLTGPLSGTTTISRQPGHNTGSFVQAQLGVQDKLFFTYGLRAEWNPDFGAEAEPNYAPRYGVAYTQELGTITVKLRGSYGRSTRPPKPEAKRSRTIADVYSYSTASAFFVPYYGSIFETRFANPELAPEYQQGGEGGMELYLGTRGSLVITRYNQTIDNLIAGAFVDTIRSTVPNPPAAEFSDADGYGYWRQAQNLNIGSIRNQGWELQGSMTFGPLTGRGTYSWTKSRVIGITPKYRPQFITVQQYQPGATFTSLPEHTWKIGVSYTNTATTIELSMNGTGKATNGLADVLMAHSLSNAIRLQQNRLNVNDFLPYVYTNKSYTLSDIAMSHRFLPRLEGLVQVQNLTDHYMNDYTAISAAMGREVKVGVRIR